MVNKDEEVNKELKIAVVKRLKTIKVGIIEEPGNDNGLKYHQSHNMDGIVSYPRGLINDIWVKIKKILERDYDYGISEKVLKIPHNQLVEYAAEKKYDLIVGDFWVTQDRLKKVNFTTPILFQKPVILYAPEKGDSTTLKYIRYLYKIWREPLLIILIAAVVISIILYYTVGKGKRPLYSMYFAIAGLFGQSNGVLDGWCKNTNATGCAPAEQPIILGPVVGFAIIFFISVYINATIIAKSVTFFGNNKLTSIEGKKILGDKDSLTGDIIIENGGKLIDNDSDLSDFDYFKKNYQQMDITGVLYATNNKASVIAKEANLKVSPINLGGYRVSFPIAKGKKELKEDIDAIIHSLDEKDEIYKICDT